MIKYRRICAYLTFLCVFVVSCPFIWAADTRTLADEVFFAEYTNGMLKFGGTVQTTDNNIGTVLIAKKNLSDLKAGIGDTDSVLHIQMINPDINGKYSEIIPFDQNLIGYELIVRFKGAEYKLDLAYPGRFSFWGYKNPESSQTVIECNMGGYPSDAMEIAAYNVSQVCYSTVVNADANSEIIHIISDADRGAGTNLELMNEGIDIKIDLDELPTYQKDQSVMPTDELLFAEYENGMLSFGGAIKSAENEIGTVIIAKKDIDDLQLGVGDMDSVRHIQMITVDSNGKFSETIPFDENLAGFELIIRFSGVEYKLDLAYEGRFSLYGYRDRSCLETVLKCDLGGYPARVMEITAYTETEEGQEQIFYNKSLKTIVGEFLHGILDTDIAEAEKLRISGNGINIEFDLEKLPVIQASADQLNMPKEYLPITGETVKERFLQRRAELPAEAGVVTKLSPSGGIQIFVAPDGDDSADGSFNNPFRTIQRGIDALKNADKSRGAVLYLRGGEYFIDDTIVLDETVADAAGHKIFISAYADEEVTINGSRKINQSDLQDVSDNSLYQRFPAGVRDSIKVIDCGILGMNAEITQSSRPSLYCGDTKLEIGRYPNTGLVNNEV